jgi:arginase
VTAGIDLGADRRGVDMGPSAIRYAHLRNKLEGLGYTVQDEGNVEVPIAEMCTINNPKLKYIDCIVPMARRVAGAVTASVQAGHFPLVLGGDHSLSIGSVRGAARERKLGVIWIDAHGDFNTLNTPSGNIRHVARHPGGAGDETLIRWEEQVPGRSDHHHRI